jgi:hypothetical protein
VAIAGSTRRAALVDTDLKTTDRNSPLQSEVDSSVVTGDLDEKGQRRSAARRPFHATDPAQTCALGYFIAAQLHNATAASQMDQQPDPFSERLRG